MATQLGLYNGALRLMGERRLASLSEDREPQRVLTDIWNDGFVDAVLEQGLWNFAMRAVELDYNTTVTPAFGYSRAFDKPSDWVRTAGVCSDEYLNAPLTRYVEEAGFWFSDLNTMYVRYISNNSSYGGNLGAWPQTFTKFAVAFMAFEASLTLTQDKDKHGAMYSIMTKRLTDAKSKDAMNDPTAFPPQGGWTSARAGTGSRGDRGRRGSLTG